MKTNDKNILNNIFSLNRNLKKTIVISTDIVLCIFSVWFAFYLRLEEFILLKGIYLSTALISISLAIPIFWIFGLYKNLLRDTSLSIFFNIAIATLAYGLVYFSIITIYGIKSVPRSIGIIQPILLFLSISFSRSIAKLLFTSNLKYLGNSKNVENILIYGAGSAGRQLLVSLENNFQYKVVGFIDDNSQLHGQYLLGQKIYNPSKLDDLKKTKNINLILFAIPSINKFKKNQIVKNIIKYQLVVKTLPNLIDIIDGNVSVSDIKDFLVDDLLDREPVEPDKKLLNKNINLKTVLVTGAGGTIGSELCRQIIRLTPKKLILLELNEFALYKIYEELIILNKNLEIIPLLANIQNQKKLEKIFATFKVDTTYHAAAYKHVPLVEANICEGVKNNIFGTLAVAKASINQNVKNLVLISSDKAVRPTNIMGATKRFAELCMQGLHQMNKDKDTNFSIVRFGNVINSSGSVIPKFKKQIEQGGPITLTHIEVTRFFMTIFEASQLVIQAGALGKNSEVFILDMGESVRIIDLIKRMVNLSGLTIKSDKNPNGDIDIKIVGLRPGEKLYEELLIGENPQKTINPKIKKTDEPFIPYNQLKKILDELLILLNNEQSKEIKEILLKTIKLYNSKTELVDSIFNESKTFNKKKDKLLLEKNQNNIVRIK